MIQKSLEALICLGLLTVFLILFFGVPLKVPELEKANYKLYTFSTLKIMDKTGKLREYALEKNTTKIKNEMARLLPYLVNYEVVIYNNIGNVTKVPEILASDIVVVDYLLAGKVGNYSALSIKVFLWGFR